MGARRLNLSFQRGLSDRDVRVISPRQADLPGAIARVNDYKGASLSRSSDDLYFSSYAALAVDNFPPAFRAHSSTKPNPPCSFYLWNLAWIMHITSPRIA